MTPIIREITADTALTEYKLKYLENSATPNILIKYKQKLLSETVDSLRERMQARYGGVNNAFKTLILDQGADMTVVGNSLEQMNYTTVQAAGENRILIASGVPGIVVGSKEGLMAATYSNYQQAMRRFADITMRPLWRSACDCLATIVSVPPNARLWFDLAGIAALRQGEKELADTTFVKAQAVAELMKYYEPDGVALAVDSGDFSLLKPRPGPVLELLSQVPAAKPPLEHLQPPAPDMSMTSPNGASAPA
jgi:phage portal protein BeeE